MTQTYGILAHPAGHSLSPAMFNAAFKASGISANYEIFDVEESGVADFLKTAKSAESEIRGLSVSLPYKEKVLDFLDETDEDAKKIAAVNTIKFEDKDVKNNGKFLSGYNTDFVGAVMALKEVSGDLNGAKAVVLGAGGASRAICYGLLKEGTSVFVLNRHPEKAKKLAIDFDKFFPGKISGAGLDDESKMQSIENGADILVQTTSIWLNLDVDKEILDEFVPPKFIDKFEIVMDILYKPLITPLLDIASDLGKVVVTGDRMLLFQALKQFEIFTGKEAPKKIMEDALKNSLN